MKTKRVLNLANRTRDRPKRNMSIISEVSQTMQQDRINITITKR